MPDARNQQGSMSIEPSNSGFQNAQQIDPVSGKSFGKSRYVATRVLEVESLGKVTANGSYAQMIEATSEKIGNIETQTGSPYSQLSTIRTVCDSHRELQTSDTDHGMTRFWCLGVA